MSPGSEPPSRSGVTYGVAVRAGSTVPVTLAGDRHWAGGRHSSCPRAVLMGLLRAARPARLAQLPLTYAPVGAARSGKIPDGFRGANRAAGGRAGRAGFQPAAPARFDRRAPRGAGPPGAG